MEILNYENVLKLIKTQTIEFKRSLQASQMQFELLLKREAEERRKEAKERAEERSEERKKEAEERRKIDIAREKAHSKERKEWQNRMRKLEGNWGFFVESLVRPGLLGLFKSINISLRNTFENIVVFKDKKKYYEIDLFSTNDIYVVATEVKTTLKVQDVRNHIKRLHKITEHPPREFNLKGKILLGAVAGIRIHSEADKYAQKNGLFVLVQKGNLLDILKPNKAKEFKF